MIVIVEEDQINTLVCSPGAFIRHIYKQPQRSTTSDSTLVILQVGYHYPKVAGYLSPRKLVLAQQTIAKEHGCLVLDGNVSNVSGNFESGCLQTF